MFLYSVDTGFALRLGAYNVAFRQGDLFAAVADGPCFDLITANPPYIAAGEIPGLQPEVRDHEPRLALDGGGDGLAVLRRVVAGAMPYLVRHGVLAVEVGAGEAPAVRDLFEEAGSVDIDVLRDYGRIERLVSASGGSAARLLGLRYPKDGGEPEPTHGGLVARWGDKPVRDVDGHDVFAVIDEARRISVPGLEARSKYHSDARARGLFVAVSSLFAWAQRRRLVEVNPCRSVPRPAGARARDRVLSKDEIRWFWQACDSADAPRAPDAPQPFAPLLRLLLVTGQRLGEVAGMTREELHADGMWHLPGRRTKNGKAHVVPLPPAARDSSR